MRFLFFTVKKQNGCSVLLLFLFCVLDGFCLAKDVDFDLAGVGQLFLDLLCDIACQEHHLILGNIFGLYHYADLAACLNCVAACNAGEALGYLLELFEALDVVFDILAARAGA